MSAATERIRSMTFAELVDGLYEVIADLHRGPGTPNGEPFAGCPGCEAQALLDELVCRAAGDPE